MLLVVKIIKCWFLILGSFVLDVVIMIIEKYGEFEWKLIIGYFVLRESFIFCFCNFWVEWMLCIMDKF